MHVHTRRPPLTLWAWRFNTNASIQAALAPQNCSGAFLFLKIILCGRACNYLRFFCCCIVLCFPVCLAAEVVPQRAAHRAGEEGGAGCTLPECEMPFLMFSHILTVVRPYWVSLYFMRQTTELSPQLCSSADCCSLVQISSNSIFW